MNVTICMIETQYLIENNSKTTYEMLKQCNVIAFENDIYFFILKIIFIASSRQC